MFVAACRPSRQPFTLCPRHFQKRSDLTLGKIFAVDVSSARQNRCYSQASINTGKSRISKRLAPAAGRGFAPQRRSRALQSVTAFVFCRHSANNYCKDSRRLIDGRMAAVQTHLLSDTCNPSPPVNHRGRPPRRAHSLVGAAPAPRVFARSLPGSMS